MSKSLVRIAWLRHSNFNLVGRLLLGKRGQEKEPANDNDENDDEHN